MPTPNPVEEAKYWYSFNHGPVHYIQYSTELDYGAGSEQNACGPLCALLWSEVRQIPGWQLCLMLRVRAHLTTCMQPCALSMRRDLGIHWCIMFSQLAAWPSCGFSCRSLLCQGCSGMQSQTV